MPTFTTTTMKRWRYVTIRFNIRARFLFLAAFCRVPIFKHLLRVNRRIICTLIVHCSFQFDYYNSLVINKVDEDGNALPLGGEFPLEENEHFNKLPVNTQLSNIQVPTNVYNRGTDAQKQAACVPLQYPVEYIWLLVEYPFRSSIPLCFSRSRHFEWSLYVWGSEWSLHWQLPEGSDPHVAVLWQLYGLLQAVPRSAHIWVSLQARIHLRLHVSPASAQCLDNISGSLDNCSKHPATQAKRYTYTASDKAGSCPSNVMTHVSSAAWLPVNALLCGCPLCVCN